MPQTTRPEAGSEIRRPDSVQQLTLEQVARDVRVLILAAVAEVGIPLPTRVENLALETGVDQRVVRFRVTAATAQSGHAAEEARVRTVDTAERDAERVVVVVGRDDRVVLESHRTAAQPAGSPTSCGCTALRRTETRVVVEVIVELREQAGAFLRRDQEVQRLVVVRVARFEAAIVRCYVRARTISDTRQSVATELSLERRAADIDLTRGRAARATGGRDAAVEVQRELREVAVPGRNALLFVVVRGDRDAHLFGAGTEKEPCLALLAVGPAGLTPLHTGLGAVHVGTRDEVHHARDGVGAVDRACAFLQHLNALDRVDRESC